VKSFLLPPKLSIFQAASETDFENGTGVMNSNHKINVTLLSRI
jgi:hypothetical protein